MAIGSGIIGDCDGLVGFMKGAYFCRGRELHMGLLRNDFVERAFCRCADGVPGILSKLQRGGRSGAPNVMRTIYCHLFVGHFR